MKAIITKYHQWTSTRPAYLSASDCDGNRVKLSLSHIDGGATHEESHRMAAQKLCDKMGWSGGETLIAGHLGNASYAFVFPPVAAPDPLALSHGNLGGSNPPKENAHAEEESNSRAALRGGLRA